jgi:diaminohydroxyphosphoribosylaminopyrimidine deaminase/5-amino-6-(5-phosphoribosylamino)uracil reductase
MDVLEKYMSRCLELAGNGRGNAAPNPMVGAVIVRDGRIIGEGYHRCYGEAHAEVNAVASVGDETLLRDSTLYVSLEPCSHYGKTPPCAELIIRKGISRVVIACLDPFPEVAGRGVKMLRDAGIKVIMGVMEKEAFVLNRFFMTMHGKHRPYVILKWAQSEDGFLDRIRQDRSEAPVLLSTSVTRLMVHKLRSEVQSIMVGTNTAVLDNPSLTVRYWAGRSPLRVTIDHHMRIPENAHLFDGKYPTLVYRRPAARGKPVAMEWEKANIPHGNRLAGVDCVDNRNSGCLFAGKNVEYVTIDDSTHFLRNMMTDLYERDINSLLVEGGVQLHRSFLDADLWDEIIVETAPVSLGTGVPAVNLRDSSGVQLSELRPVPSFFSYLNRSSVIATYIHR